MPQCPHCLGKGYYKPKNRNLWPYKCAECGGRGVVPEKVKPEVKITQIASSSHQGAGGSSLSREEFYRFMVTKARSLGFKPGFAAAKYKEQFGEWPPREWLKDTKAIFASDAMWQKLHHQRQELLFRESAPATPPEPEKPKEPEKPAMVEDHGGEESFSAWLESEGIFYQRD